MTDYRMGPDHGSDGLAADDERAYSRERAREISDRHLDDLPPEDNEGPACPDCGGRVWKALAGLTELGGGTCAGCGKRIGMEELRHMWRERKDRERSKRRRSDSG